MTEVLGEIRGIDARRKKERERLKIRANKRKKVILLDDYFTNDGDDDDVFLKSPPRKFYFRLSSSLLPIQSPTRCNAMSLSRNSDVYFTLFERRRAKYLNSSSRMYHNDAQITRELAIN